MMETTIVTVLGSVLIACLTYLFTKNQSNATHWRDQKLNHYKVLLSAMSGTAGDGTDNETAQKNYALAVNTITLVAPQNVIAALMDFFEETKASNMNKSDERHDALLIKLVLAIRKDIGLAKSDDPATFRFHLVSSGTVGKQE